MCSVSFFLSFWRCLRFGVVAFAFRAKVEAGSSLFFYLCDFQTGGLSFLVYWYKKVVCPLSLCHYFIGWLVSTSFGCAGMLYCWLRGWPILYFMGTADIIYWLCMRWSMGLLGDMGEVAVRATVVLQDVGSSSSRPAPLRISPSNSVK